MWTRIKLFFSALFSGNSQEKRILNLEISLKYALQTLDSHNTAFESLLKIIKRNDQDHELLVNAIKTVNTKIDSVIPKEEISSLEEKDLN